MRFFCHQVCIAAVLAIISSTSIAQPTAPAKWVRLSDATLPAKAFKPQQGSILVYAADYPFLTDNPISALLLAKGRQDGFDGSDRSVLFSMITSGQYQALTQSLFTQVPQSVDGFNVLMESISGSANATSSIFMGSFVYLSDNATLTHSIGAPAIQEMFKIDGSLLADLTSGKMTKLQEGMGAKLAVSQDNFNTDDIIGIASIFLNNPGITSKKYVTTPGVSWYGHTTNRARLDIPARSATRPQDGTAILKGLFGEEAEKKIKNFTLDIHFSPALMQALPAALRSKKGKIDLEGFILGMEVNSDLGHKFIYRVQNIYTGLPIVAASFEVPAEFEKTTEADAKSLMAKKALSNLFKGKSQ
jgi:hypothetical protein